MLRCGFLPWARHRLGTGPFHGPENAVLDRRSSNGGTPLNIVRNLWKDVRTLDIDGFIAQKRAQRWPGHCSDRRHSIGISCVCLRCCGGITLQPALTTPVL